MFNHASSFNQDIRDWNVSNVTDLGGIFSGPIRFIHDIGNWDVSNASNMVFMFYGASEFNQDISGCDVSNVTDMSAMLSNSGLSTVNYDNVLIGWAAKTVQSNVTLGAYGLTYCAAIDDRQSLIDDYGWTISGDAIKSTTCNPVATEMSVEEPNDITAECPTLFSDLILPGMIEVTYDDNSTQEVSVIWQEGNYDPTGGQYVLIGILDLTIDENPNNLTAQVTVNEEDNVAPVANTQALPDFTAQCEVTANDLTAPTATDNCSGTVTGTNNATFPISTQGTTTITWNYEDNAGNQSTQTQDIVINDYIPPEPYETALTTLAGECSVILSTAPKANDVCSGTVTGTTNDPLEYYEQGTYTITWTYDDGNGNTIT